MIENQDITLITDIVSRQIEAQIVAVRIVFEIAVEQISEVAARDMKPVFRGALMDAIDNIQRQSKAEGDLFDEVAFELDGYVRQIEYGDQDTAGDVGQR